MPISIVRGLMAVAAMTVGAAPSLASEHPKRPSIKHVIIMMQENRTFDNFFGTFPGADGFPPGTCVPLDPNTPAQGCVAPFHDVHDVNAGGPHTANAAETDLNNGITTTKMDGFVWMQTLATKSQDCPTRRCASLTDGIVRHDAVGYHTAEEMPNTWAYAQTFVLQDHMFEGERSWSFPAHLDLTSEWAALCTNDADAMSCKTSNWTKEVLAPHLQLPWVNLFELLDLKNITWKYYVGEGAEPDCSNGAMSCNAPTQSAGSGSIWNPTPFFASVKAQGATYLANHNPSLPQFFTDVKNGQLPQVSWLIPASGYSDHPPDGVTSGMVYLTTVVNTIMQSPYWLDTAIFVTWDDWGGFYDHVAPPNVDTNTDHDSIEGFGLRVPGLMISAYAKSGLVDHQVLSFDSYATFIENIFMGGTRLDPAALGNPDNRPDLRDSLKTVKYPNGQTAKIGGLLEEFDFTQSPIPPVLLSAAIPTGIEVTCSTSLRQECTTPTVTVGWTAITDPFDAGPFTYHIQRDGVELPQCEGTSTTCTDTPGSGAHFYRAYSVDATGVTSPLSAAAEADEP